MGYYVWVMELYEDAIRPDVARIRTSMYDAASLLWRYQIYGCAQDELPWSAVGELAARVTAQPGMAFVDANAAMALAAARDEVAFGRLIDGLRALDAQGHPTAGCVVLPLVQGIWAFAQGAYRVALNARHLLQIFIDPQRSPLIHFHRFRERAADGCRI
jgi:hypothetical protein